MKKTMSLHLRTPRYRLLPRLSVRHLPLVQPVTLPVQQGRVMLQEQPAERQHPQLQEAVQLARPLAPQPAAAHPRALTVHQVRVQTVHLAPVRVLIQIQIQVRVQTGLRIVITLRRSMMMLSRLLSSPSSISISMRSRQHWENSSVIIRCRSLSAV